MTEALAGGSVAALDDLLAPDYRNPMMGDMGRDGFMAMLPAMRSVIPEMSFDILDLIAEVASSSTQHPAGPPQRGIDGNLGNFTHTLGGDANPWWRH